MKKGKPHAVVSFSQLWFVYLKVCIYIRFVFFEFQNGEPVY